MLSKIASSNDIDGGIEWTETSSDSDCAIFRMLRSLSETTAFTKHPNKGNNYNLIAKLNLETIKSRRHSRGMSLSSLTLIETPNGVFHDQEFRRTDI